MKKMPLVTINHVEKSFAINKSWLAQLQPAKKSKKTEIHALNDISLTIEEGESLCLVGETGCGKSTLAKVLMGLLEPTKGQIYYRNQRIDNLTHKQRLPFRKSMQMIFQNPYTSLNPRMTIYQTLSEPVGFHNPHFSKNDVDDKVAELMQSVDLNPELSDYYPHEFSGGQRQRISIARALSVEPDFIVADEPLASLDVSVQAQVLNLMMDKQAEKSLTYLFISHDLTVVEHFATRVVVMYLGQICEIADRETLFEQPKHPYTKALLSAIPRLDDNTSKVINLTGEVPTPLIKPQGCSFQARCLHANQRCAEQIPNVLKNKNSSFIACHAIEEERI